MARFDRLRNANGGVLGKQLKLVDYDDKADQLEDGQLPEYRELFTEVISPKFATSFEGSVSTAEELVNQAEERAKRTG